MKCSLHVHSTYSDGSGTIQENVESAKRLKIDYLGFSDHFHLPFQGENQDSDMPLELIDEYVSEILSYSESINPQILLGLEVEFVPQTIPHLKEIIARYPFDYLIGSVHFVDGVWIDSLKEILPEDLCFDLMKKYWIKVRQMVESGLFDIVGHIDVVKKYGNRAAKDLSKQIEETIVAISRSGMAVELNTSGWFYPCQEQYPALEILKKCTQFQIPLIISADSHKPENLDREFGRAMQMLKKLNVQNLAYFVKRKLYNDSLS